MSRELHVYQSLWAMRPYDLANPPFAEICARVAGAGYRGIALDFGADDVSVAKSIRPHMEREGLTPLLVAFPKTVESLRETLIMAKDFGAPFVDVIGQVTPLSVDGSIPVIRRWIEMAEEVGVPVQFETHRNCITNDLYPTLQLLDAIPEMRLCADLSHYVVDREFWHPLSERDLGLVSRILARSDSFQGRVASRQQIQLQLDFPQHAKWVEQFRGWWAEGLAGWRRRNATGDCLFLCELGPPEYAMTGPDGREMSDRWEEALTIKSWVEEIWAGLEAAESGEGADG